LDFRIGIKLQFVDDTKQSNSDTLLIGDYVDKYIEVPASQLPMTDKRLLWMKAKEGSKVIAGTEELPRLEEFIEKFIEVNTVDSTGYQPKLTFLVDTNAEHSILDQDVIDHFQQKVEDMKLVTDPTSPQNWISPYILRTQNDLVTQMVVPFVNDNMVFSTITLKTGENPRILEALIVQLICYCENAEVGLIDMFNRWMLQVDQRISFDEKNLLIQDKSIADVQSDILFYDVYRQMFDSWITDAKTYVENKPYYYTLDTRGYSTSQALAIRAYSSNGSDIPVITLHMMDGLALTKENASMKVTRYGACIEASYNKELAGEFWPYLNDSGSTFRVRGQRMYQFFANTPTLRLDIKAVETVYAKKDTSTSNVYMSSLKKNGPALEYGQFSLSSSQYMQFQGSGVIGNSGFAATDNLFTYGLYNIGTSSSPHWAVRNETTGTTSTIGSRSATTAKSGVANIEIYDMQTGSVSYAPMKAKIPPKRDYALELQDMSDGTTWYPLTADEYKQIGDADFTYQGPGSLGPTGGGTGVGNTGDGFGLIFVNGRNRSGQFEYWGGNVVEVARIPSTNEWVDAVDGANVTMAFNINFGVSLIPGGFGEKVIHEGTQSCPDCSYCSDGECCCP